MPHGWDMTRQGEAVILPERGRGSRVGESVAELLCNTSGMGRQNEFLPAVQFQCNTTELIS